MPLEEGVENRNLGGVCGGLGSLQPVFVVPTQGEYHRILSMPAGVLQHLQRVSAAVCQLPHVVWGCVPETAGKWSHVPRSFSGVASIHQATLFLGGHGPYSPSKNYQRQILPKKLLPPKNQKIQVVLVIVVSPRFLCPKIFVICSPAGPCFLCDLLLSWMGMLF